MKTVEEETRTDKLVGTGQGGKIYCTTILKDMLSRRIEILKKVGGWAGKIQDI